MKFFNGWLDSMGQNPKTIVWDTLWFFIRFYVLVNLLILPLFSITKLLKPYFPTPAGNQPLDLSQFLPLQVFFCFVGFGIYMFFGVALLLAVLGGWFKLSRKFPAPKIFTNGQLFKWKSACVGACNYNNILKVRVSSEGLWLACSFPFSMMHPPMLIPWHEVKDMRQKRSRFQLSTRFIIGSPKIASILMQDRKVVEAAKPFLPQCHFL